MKDTSTNSRKSEVKRYEEDGILEVQGVVEIVVVNYNAGTQDDPDRDDDSRSYFEPGFR